MATSENALPKLLREHLTEAGFKYDRVKTTPNFTYDVSRIVETPIDQEMSKEEIEATGKAYDVELQAALANFEVTTFKTINVQYDEMVPPADQEVRQHRYTARIKAQGYEAPAPVYKVKEERPKKTRESAAGDEGLKIIIGGEATPASEPVKKSKSSQKAGGKKGIVQPAVIDEIPGEELASV